LPTLTFPQRFRLNAPLNAPDRVDFLWWRPKRLYRHPAARAASSCNDKEKRSVDPATARAPDPAQLDQTGD